MRCDGSSLQYATRALCAFSDSSGWRCNWRLSAGTMAFCAPRILLVFCHDMPLLRFYAPLCALCMKPAGGGHFATAPALCAPTWG